MDFVRGVVLSVVLQHVKGLRRWLGSGEVFGAVVTGYLGMQVRVAVVRAGHHDASVHGVVRVEG